MELKSEYPLTRGRRCKVTQKATMVSDSVRRLVLVVIVMISASNGLRVSINAAIDVLA